jgi:hypothetical protein
MQINLDLHANRALVTAPGLSEAIQFTHRWECVFLELLIGGLYSAKKPLSLIKFGEVLAKRGQQNFPTRMQISRLMDSIFNGFDSVGKGAWIRSRLTFNQREKTVGPWWWAGEPIKRRASDFVARDIVSSQVTPARNIPKLTREITSQSIRLTLEAFLLADALAFDGEHSKAIEVLDKFDFSVASVATQSLVVLRKARWLTLVGRLDTAEALLLNIELIASKMPLEQSQWLRLHARNLLLRVQYSRNPVLNANQVIRELTSLKRAPAIAPDPLLAAARANLLSLAQRRRMEGYSRPQDRLKAKKHLIRAMESLSTALLCYLAASSYEQVQSCCVNMAYLKQKAFAMKLTTSLDEVFGWYAAAFSWNNKFNLSENSAWEYIMLGELFLYEPRAKERFASAASRLHWQGLRPDQSGFYKAALSNSQRLGDPDQILHALLNAFVFEDQSGTRASAKTYALQWAKMASQFPRQIDALKQQGYKLPKALVRG